MEVKEPAPKYYPKMSPSQFLIWERKQEYKHEYVNGEVLAMSGASLIITGYLLIYMAEYGIFYKVKHVKFFPVIYALL
jgi:Uma2 family endonuclease